MKVKSYNYLCLPLQVMYLSLISFLVMIDSIATRTFRWKEYGELTNTQTDGTSIIFFICPSRWVWRMASGLILASALSLRATRIVAYAKVSLYNYLNTNVKKLEIITFPV